MRRGRRSAPGPWPDLTADADVLVLASPAVPTVDLASWGLPESARVRPVVDLAPHSRVSDAVVLVVHDLADLRRTITGLPQLGTSRRVAVLFAEDVARLPTRVGHPQWPRVESLVVRRTPRPCVVLELEEPGPVRHVLVQVARAAGTSRTLPTGWPAVGAERARPEDWPVADPGAKVAAPARLLDQSVDLPPDLVLLGGEHGPDHPGPTEPHPVLGRPTHVALVEPEPSWESLLALSPAEVATVLERAAPSLGAVDQHVVNPIGFDRDVVGQAAPLTAEGAGWVTSPAAGVPSVTLGQRVSDIDVPLLRALPGLELGWNGGRGPLDLGRLVVGLAAAGVPLQANPVPAWAEALLGAGLAGALTRPADLTDRLGREEHSVRLRRAALRDHGTTGWRRRLAARHGLQPVPRPSVSVLLVTRRPEMLEFALRQVGRQRAVDVEVVLVPHGFDPDPATLADARRRYPAALTVVPAAAGLPFGQVMNLAVSAAGGDLVLKMDDDDWYGPDFAADLLLALDYSGADLVGAPAEFTFLEELWLTTRSASPTEAFRPAVAGGTMLTSRAVLREVGGFRDTVRYVDATLLAAVGAAGGTTYRSHGLGYVLRRGATGHTWDPGLAYFLRPERAREQWRGFRPSALLEPEDLDRPRPAPEDGS